MDCQLECSDYLFFIKIQLDAHEFEQELVMDRETWRGAVHGVTKRHE